MNGLQQKKLKLAIYLCIYSDVKRLFFFVKIHSKSLQKYGGISANHPQNFITIHFLTICKK